MDALSEVLRLVRLTGAVFLNAEFSAPWSVQSPPSPVLAKSLMPDAEHLVEYHFIAEGRCFIRTADEEPIALDEGDLVMLPHGDAHRMASDPDRDPEPLAAESIVLPPPGEIASLRHGSGGALTRVVCGYLAVDRKLCGSLIAALPRILRVSARGGEISNWLQTYIRLSVIERGEDRPGGACVLAKLSELMFVEAIRRYVESLPPEQTGWLAAVRDPFVGKALGLLHARPSHPWTVESLGREIGLSRAALAERFTRFIGQPPMQYLTQWRLTLGAHLLRATNKGVAEIAADVGYDSEAAFNRAFKREFAAPPGTWRKTAVHVPRGMVAGSVRSEAGAHGA
jgi:AraC family transcriptional regulator, alkane utilization regulator